MKYYTRGDRRRGDIDQWEVRIMHKDPVTQEEVFDYRTVTAETKKQALNFAIAQGLITKNPCNFCKPPKREKIKINALSREDRSRMLDLARSAFPEPLALAIKRAENRIDDFAPDEEVRSSARMIMMVALGEYARAA